MIDVSLRPKNESEIYSQTVLRLGLLNQHLRPLSPLFMLVQVQVLKKENFIIITQSENVFPPLWPYSPNPIRVTRHKRTNRE